ncbi:MAG: right-handed parallel beta-helix repeat-containing protein, partial [Candidatus Hodarchaeales archaeon]
KNNEDFSRLNAPGEGTASNPYILENLQLIDATNTLILIESVTVHVIVKNNDLDGSFLSPLAYQYGIQIKNSQNVVVENNIITGVNYGIVIDEFSMNNLITNNVIKFVEYGVTVLGGASNNVITNNIFEDISYYAVYLTSISTIQEISNIVIANNHFKHVKVGIYAIGVINSEIRDNVIKAKDYGIILDSSSRNIIENNFIFDSSIGLLISTIFSIENFSSSNIVMNNVFDHLTTHGLVLGANIDTQIILNDFSYIGDYAIFLSADSVNVVIEENIFTENNLESASQVYDDGTNSFFTENYWSDQTEEGVYNIDGQSSSVDSLPNFKAGGSHQITKPDLIQPIGGEVISGIYPIQWTESVDNKRHDVKYKIYYQNEKVPDESAWLLVADEITDTFYNWETRQIENGLFRVFVIAYDDYGIENNGVASNFFEIFNEEHTLSKPEILYPNGSEVLNGTVLVDWMDSVDSLGHQVYYDVFLTSDNGTAWKKLASNLTDSHHNLSTRYLFPFTDYKLKVFATDHLGLNATDETDGSFTIDNNFPGYYYIVDNIDFSGYEIPGLGTLQDPFILTGFSYNYPDLSFVYLQGTTNYFRISNNDIDTSNGVSNTIDLRNSQNIEVTGNNVTGGANGIFVSNSNNIRISNNKVFQNSENGIYITSVTTSIISNNFVNDNAGHGIFVENSQIITVSSNDVFNNGQSTVTRLSVSGGNAINGLNAFFGSGIYLDPTVDATVTLNNVYGNALDGISLEYTDFSTIYENFLFSNGESGLSLINSSNNDLEKNTVYNNGFSFSGQTGSFGRFSVQNINAFFGTGIFLDPSDNNSITQNEVYNNAENGIYLVDSSYNAIENNNVYRNGAGEPATASSTSFNAFFGSGIFLDPSNHNTISNNIVYENGHNGIELLESDDVTLSNNSVYSNGGDGLALINSDLNSLSENYIFNNGYGTSEPTSAFYCWF